MRTKANKKQRLRVQPLSLILLSFFCFLFLVVGTLACAFTSRAADGGHITGICVCGVGAAACLAVFIYLLQYADVDEEGISIRSLFFKTRKIKWCEIYAIEREKLTSVRSPWDKKWLVIKEKKSDDLFGFYKFNGRKLPWLIIASKKNIETIGQYADIDGLRAVDKNCAV